MYLRRIGITIPPEHAKRLSELGDGNRSAGVRFLLDFYDEMTFGSQRALDQGAAIFKRLNLSHPDAK